MADQIERPLTDDEIAVHIDSGGNPHDLTYEPDPDATQAPATADGVKPPSLRETLEMLNTAGDTTLNSDGTGVVTEPMTDADREAFIADVGRPEEQIGQRVEEILTHAKDIIAEDVITSVVCTKCKTKASWRGALDPTNTNSPFAQRGINATTGLPYCPHCGTPMVHDGKISGPDALTQAAAALDAERAGNAARPTYQPSIPGILPPFDYRSAAVATEALEANVQSAEAAYNKAKDVASGKKKDLDEAIGTLREHIQETHRRRIEAEYQNGRQSVQETMNTLVDAERTGPDAVDRVTAPRGVCSFERATGQPCSVCRNPKAATIAQPNSIRHIADSLSALLVSTKEVDVDGLYPEFAGALLQIADVHVPADDIAAWSAESRRDVAKWLLDFAILRDNKDEPWTLPIPLAMGSFHEAAEASGEQQACRICGAVLLRFAGQPIDATIEPYRVGQKVGIKCEGEQQEAARTPSRRHATPRDAAKAKQAADKPKTKNAGTKGGKKGTK